MMSRGSSSLFYEGTPQVFSQTHDASLHTDSYIRADFINESVFS